MIKKIDHIGIIVPDVTEATKLFRDGLHMEFLRIEDLPEWSCKIAFFKCGEVLIELVEPTGPSDGQRFLEEVGGGIHHIAYEVEDIEETFAEIQPKFESKSESPVEGAGNSKVFFIEENKLLNIVTEFVELEREM